MNPSSGSQAIQNKIRAALNLASTTARSLTGAVMRVSKVPEDFSSANSRMVMTGAEKSRISQRNSERRKISVIGSKVGTRLKLGHQAARSSGPSGRPPRQ